MNDAAVYGIEIAVGMLVIPFLTWVTLSIFGLKQQLAVLKAELGVLKEIKEMMKAQRGYT